MKHPIQPLVEDDRGVVRFKSNAIVMHLLDNGGMTMNDIAKLGFDREDREQFAQLIGYSWAGACDLPYMTGETLDAAETIRKSGVSEAEARADVLRGLVDKVKDSIREGVADLFCVHPDDLK